MMSSILMRELMNLRDVRIIDVREPEEHQLGTIPGALRIPMEAILRDSVQLPKDGTYYIVCHTGSRSYMVADYLDHHGYDVVNVLGGMSSYKGALTYEM